MKLISGVKVDKGGRIVMSTEFRKRLGIRAGDRVVFQMEGDELRALSFKADLRWAQQPVRKHVPLGASLVDELMEERREQKSS